MGGSADDDDNARLDLARAIIEGKPQRHTRDLEAAAKALTRGEPKTPGGLPTLEEAVLRDAAQAAIRGHRQAAEVHLKRLGEADVIVAELLEQTDSFQADEVALGQAPKVTATELFDALKRSLEDARSKDKSRDTGPLHIYFDMATITPEKAVLVIESLSRMVGEPLEIISVTPIPPDPSRYRIQLGRKAA